MKKNYRVIPKHLIQKINSSSSNEFRVAVALRFNKTDIKDKKYLSLEIKYNEGELLFTPEFLAPNKAGKYSKTNRLGRILIRKDLPKVSKTFSFEAPDWGDWSNGSHDVSWDREVYQRTKIEPKKINIKIRLINDNGDTVIFGFTVDNILNKNNENFRESLLSDINLLQENVGSIGVIELNEELQEKLAFSRLEWEVLPQGWWNNKQEVDKIKATLGKKESDLLLERLKYIESLGPKERYVGQTNLGNRSYYVFVFEQYVIAESPMFGNAIYILIGEQKELWKEVFSGTKRNALNSGAIRIPHSANWEKSLLKKIL